MSADGSDEFAAEEDEGFVESYEFATEADVIPPDDDEVAADAETAEEDDEGAVAGSFAPDLRVSPQTPTPENAVFVAVGVYIATLALGQLVVGSVVYEPTGLVGITVGVAALTAACYGILVRTDPDT